MRRGRLAARRRCRVGSHRPETLRVVSRASVSGVPKSGRIGGTVTVSAPLHLHRLRARGARVPALLYAQKCQRGSLPVLIFEIIYYFI